MVIYEAWVRKFRHYTHTGYYWGTGIAGVPLQAYPRRTPLFPKKNFPSMNRVRVRLKVAKNYVVFWQKLFDSQSLSLPSSLCCHSHILSLSATMHSELWFGLAATENQCGALIWTCGFLLSLWLPFLFTGHLSLSPLVLKAKAPFSLYLPFQT